MRLKGSLVKRSVLKQYQVGSTTVIVRSHGASKSLRLKIDPIHKVPVLTVPINCSLNFIKKFLDQSREWLDEQMAPYEARVLQEQVFYKGEKYQVSHAPFGQANSVAGINGEAKIIYLGCSPDLAPLRLKRLLREQALDYGRTQSHKWAKMLNVSIENVLIKDYRARWGSCSSQGILTYSWRLIQAPCHVFDYVCAHEVAHLVHLNHSRKFWQVVASICPHFQESRHWLKVNGPQLFHYL